MNKIVILFLGAFFHAFLAFSQTNDTTQITTIESQFSDSIAQINEKNDHLKTRVQFYYYT